LANGKAPTALRTSEKLLLNVEPLSEARTPVGDFFSIVIDFVAACGNREGRNGVGTNSSQQPGRG
jgi:hypothetical protein